MKRARNIMLLLIPLSFIFGVWWEYKNKNLLHISLFEQPRGLKILSPRGYFPKKVGDDFFNPLNLKWELAETKNWSELLSELDSLDFDIAIAPTFLLSADTLKKTSGMNPKVFSGWLSKIAPDFAVPEIWISQEKILPLSWTLMSWAAAETNSLQWEQILTRWNDSPSIGINSPTLDVLSSLAQAGIIPENWSELEEIDSLKIPLRRFLKNLHSTENLESDNVEFAYLSHQALAQSQNSKFMNLTADTPLKNNMWIWALVFNPKKETRKLMRQFTEFLLKPMISAQLSLHNGYASTLAAANSLPSFPAHLKPSHIREFSLTDLEPLMVAPSDPLVWQNLIDQTLQ